MNSLDTPYNPEFHLGHASGSLQSAKVIAPLVIDLIKPKSVVDIGCGIGAWLRVFEDLGVNDYLGLDGEYVNQSDLLISTERFRPADLTAPPSLGRTFDMAICLEVVEHLPETVADRIVAYLTGIAPVILFSAALPGQGGTNHVNEQWPVYWLQHFKNQGFVRLDPIRPKILRDQRVQWWYQQNTFLYVREEMLNTIVELREEHTAAMAYPFEIVHEKILRMTMSAKPSLRQLMKAFLGGLSRRSQYPR